MPVTRDWPFLLVLAVQNLTVYWGHYFRGVGFPWDFSMSYYAMVAFWTSAVGQGVFPQWIPFQQMGYPFALQVQSGINYLPLWMYPALNVPYTLHAAIVLQCVHVLAGSVGMFMLARHLHASRKYALVAAVAFQFFGGFYSNAEHVDIIRAFAYAPWLLYVFSVDRAVPASLPRRAMLIPPVLYLFLTGAYPGNIIACGVILPFFVGLQLLDAFVGGATLSRLIPMAARLAGLGVLGCAMATLHLGPVWLFRDQFVRAETLVAVPRVGLWLQHLPGLFLSNRALPGEISMTSTYVSLPVLLLASFAPLGALRRYWVYLSLLVIAALMAAGDNVFLGPMARSVLPVLGLSRFPSSDYRVFVAIPLILSSLLGLRAVVEKQLAGKEMAVRSVLCAAWLFWGLSRVHQPIGLETAAAVVLAAASLVTMVVLRRGPARLTVAALATVVVLVSMDAVRVLPTVAGWHEPDIDEYYLRQGWPAYTRNRGRRLVASSIFRSLPSTRPPRIVPPGLVRWSGYLDGSYLTTDLTPNVLRAATAVGSNSLYQEYMLKEWSPRLIAREPRGSGLSPVAVTDAEFAGWLASPNATATGTVRQTHYGVNDIAYQVSLPEARLLVENEMYFPGWRATLTTRQGDTLDAVAVNGVFRSWWLPAGEYTMLAHFAFPHLWRLRLVSAVSLFVWISVWFLWRRHARAP